MSTLRVRRQNEPHSFRTSKSRRNQHQNSGAIHFQNAATSSSVGGIVGTNGPNQSRTIANFHNSTYHPPANGLTTRGTSRFCISNEYAGIGQWGYGMWRQQSTDIYNIERDEEYRENYLKSIREFGYNYLKPSGIRQTMRSLLERAVQGDEDLDISRGHIDISGMADPNEREELELQQEQLEVRGVENEENDRARNVAEEDTTNDVGNERMANMRHAIDGEEDDTFRSDQDEDENEEEVDLDADIPDLDAEIPEAVDNSYDDSYDEDEYQEGFMADEEYGDVVTENDVQDADNSASMIMPSDQSAIGPAIALPDEDSFVRPVHPNQDIAHADVSYSSNAGYGLDDGDSELEMDVSNMSFQ
ncbi:hypothetical protein AWJ20_113 [Sugiyamaella lignohabitans]|uniref:Uncharacterized protein n=1 Tax=Sugiyamaella lignohabitans TaxID=796027 RepID=A0A167CMH0_9ASCO|nr:uncharacterized protein AWJ20_113 [Sugiyamaella lignohabitans]ANB11886.1 hypothetical protein AWJ20_113 [Sugiyamaella lignohabitans]